MKKAALFLLLAVVLVNASCKKTIGSSEHDVYVDLQYGFGNDLVTIIIDGEEVFNDRVSSHPALGLALGLSSRQKDGIHIMKVVVNNQLSNSKLLMLNKDIWVGVGYTHLGTIDFKLSDKPFMYD